MTDGRVKAGIRGKVSTMSTLLITNNLSVYKNVYKKFKVSTSLLANGLSVYVNDNGVSPLIKHPLACHTL